MPMVTVVIDEQTLEVPQGRMIIEVADEAGITIPRFCYHKKLSVAANCRMCLVEIENGRKPMPACATPVSDGMKVFTKSKKTVEFQKAVMEFLLINHPLDCPICDQGGECELQDMAMGYGSDVSRYTQGKRVVADPDFGPLISTDLTRCIHCTRCVRFGNENEGIREIGMTGRGEHSQIDSFLSGYVNSEMSGNVIDLCPVGALTSKPFRYRARAWEMAQKATVAAHDCIGSNLFAHTRRNDVMRVVPKENEQLNETWISDRDRFAYEGLHSADRLTEPMIKRDGEWEKVSWSEAFETILKRFNRVKDKHGLEQFGALASANSTLEELYLLQKIFRTMGCDNVDHRLRQHDVRHQKWQPLAPGLDCSLIELEEAQTIWLFGSNIRKAMPIMHHRLRQAYRKGSQIFGTNPADFEFRFKQAAKQIVGIDDMVVALSEVTKALIDLNPDASCLNEAKIALFADIEPSDTSVKIAKALHKDKAPVIVLGDIALNHPQASSLYAMMDLVRALTGAKGGVLTEGANQAGAWLAGCVPHRTTAGVGVDKVGLDAHAMLTDKPVKAYVLMNVEPEFDSAYGQRAVKALNQADCVVALTPFAGEGVRAYADVMLPIGAWTETSGTFVNALGDWQTMQGIVAPKGEARPAWKVLRVLANFMEMDGFDYESREAVTAEIQALLDKEKCTPEKAKLPKALPKGQRTAKRVAEVPLYAPDQIVRRASSLQQTTEATTAAVVKMNAVMAKKLGVSEGEKVQVSQEAGIAVKLPVKICDSIADRNVFIPQALPETALLGAAFDKVTIEKVAA